jgi:hypothetical protein
VDLWGQSPSKSLGSALFNTAVLSFVIFAVKAVYYLVFCFQEIWAIHKLCFSQIHSKTLQGMLESHNLYQRRMQVFYGQLAVMEFGDADDIHTYMT